MEKKKKKISNIRKLPNDLLIDVLVRLPTTMESTLRLVSKSWKTLIDSSQFRHVRYMDMNSSMIYHSRINNKIFLAGTEYMDSPETMMPANSKIETDENIVHLVGSCNGFLFLDTNFNVVVVMNPLTKQTIELPPSVSVENEGRYWTRSIGFGYDNVNDDYKVVRLIWHSNDKFDDVKVYSFRSKRWRDLELPGSENILRYNRESVLSNRALHWIVRIPDNSFLVSKCVIVAIDLATEKFHRIPLPCDHLAVGSGSSQWSIFRQVDGYLCFSRIESSNPTECNVWMMKEYGVPDSWTKLSLRVPDFRMHDDFWLNLMCCNFDARSVLAPRIPASSDYFVFQAGEKSKCSLYPENRFDDLILWNPKSQWKSVLTFTPSFVKLPSRY